MVAAAFLDILFLLITAALFGLTLWRFQRGAADSRRTTSKKVVLISLLPALGAASLAFLLELLFRFIDSGLLYYGANILLMVSAAGFAVVLVALCGLIADVARRKGRSWGAFFALSLFFPIIMLIVVSVMSTDQATVKVGMKNCPRCAEPIRAEATLCKHCGSEV